MTKDELSKLTPEQKCIKIAGACGWHSIKQCTCKCQPHGLPRGTQNEREYKHLPDYLNDLNAMREAFFTLAYADQREYFYSALRAVMGFDLLHRPTPDQLATIINATAAQRADAFLLVVG